LTWLASQEYAITLSLDSPERARPQISIGIKIQINFNSYVINN